jgi:hypothetical protein
MRLRFGLLSAVALLSASGSACGGKVLEASEVDAGVDAERTSGDSMRDDTIVVDAVPSDVAFDVVTSDFGSPLDADSTDDASVDASLLCDGYKVVGPPDGPPEPPICGATEPFPGWAESMLACLVDRCDAARSQPAWCGTISLTFDATGFTLDYREDGPGTGGCVKYQGAYRAWLCEAMRTVTVTRACP